jgi:hypothetical protein
MWTFLSPPYVLRVAKKGPSLSETLNLPSGLSLGWWMVSFLEHLRWFARSRQLATSVE